MTTAAALPTATAHRTTVQKTTRGTPITPTSTSPCLDRNMTVFVTSLHERALVEITPTAKTLLSVGTHVMYLAGCTISIDVKIFGMLLVLTVPRTTHCIVLFTAGCILKS